MIRFAKRNLMVFFRDKSAVFFSLLSALIIVALYALFLGDTMTQGYEAVPEVRALMDSWIVAGILAITSITTTMGAYGTMVDDRARKIEKDFHCSPLHKSSIAGGYILSAFLIGVVMTLVALVLGEVYIVATGGPWLSFAARPLYKISLMSEDLPEPETPVTAVKVPSGIETSIFFRLFCAAPLTVRVLPLP